MPAPAEPAGGRRGVFVDRDGVLNDLVPDPVSGLPESPLRVAEVRLMPGAAEGLRSLAAAGFWLVGVSNQPAAAKGTSTVAELRAVQARVLELLVGLQARLDGFEICLHHPDGVVQELSVRCACRKPAPGMLLAGRAAGCRTVLVEHPGSAHKRDPPGCADWVAADLAGAARAVLSNEVLSSRQ